MKVYFDYQIFYLQRFGGISRYFIELAAALNKSKVINPKILAPYNANHYLDMVRKESYVLTFNVLLRKLFNNRLLNKPIQMNEIVTQVFCKGEHKVLHETYYTNRIKTNCPTVITIHDMIYELFNHGFDVEKQIINQKQKAIFQADLIIAVSESTKNDLLKFYPQVRDKTFVVHHGVNQEQFPEVEAYIHRKPFLLFVGNRGWYKNFQLLIEVLAEQKQFLNTFDLICFGGGAMTKEEGEMINQNKIIDKVYFLNGDDHLLTSLYKSAASLVYISKYEGFGMPLLEAMVLGCPVITSNTSSLPEVYGDAAISINPNEKEQLIEALNTLMYNSELIQNMINMGRVQASHFTWDKCAIETTTLYKKLV